MARREYQSTVADALPRIIREQAKNNSGSIKFTQADKKTIGKVYLKGGKIYAIELTTYSPKIVSRIVTNEFISESNREQVIAEYGEKLTDTEVVNFVLKYQFFPEKPLITYLKDYFFDAFDELYKWKEVSAEWRNNEEPPASVLRVPPALPESIFEKLEQRERFLNDQVSREWSIHPRETDSVRYRRNFEYDDPDYTNMLILTLPKEDELPIGYVADYLGLPKFNAKLALFNLWKNGAVDVYNPSGIWYSNRTETEIKNSQQAKTAIPTIQSPVVEETAEEIALDDTPFVIPSEEFSYDVDDEPYVPEQEPIPVQESTEFLTSVSPPAAKPVAEPEYGGDDYSYEPEPSVIIPIIEEETEPKFTLDPEPATPEPLYPNLETIKPIIEETFMSDAAANAAPTSAASRLRALKEQLRLELESLQETIAEAQRNVTNKEQYLQHLKTERNALVSKLRELDKSIAHENQAVVDAKNEVARLQAEFNESKDLL